jgi:soluble lytic murein transglycosylase-like protein
MRRIPEVRVLGTRARRPAIMVAVGMALMTPVAFIARPAAEPEPRAANEEVVVPGAVADDVIMKAEQFALLERERPRIAAQYAEKFGVSPHLAEQIHLAAEEADIPPRLAFGLIQTESSFRRSVVSWAGAVGYTQVLPSTARYIAPGTTRSDLFHTEKNLQVGFTYLRYLIDKYDGDLRLALTAYNRGPGTVNRLVRQGRSWENGYADKVLNPRLRG